MEDPLRSTEKRDLVQAKTLLSALSVLFVLLLLQSIPVIIAPALALLELRMPGLLAPWYWGMLVEFALRCAFVSVACALGKGVGKTWVSFGTVQVVLAFLIPIFNLFRPF